MILVIGGSGMIGREIVSAAAHMGLPCEFTLRKPEARHFLDLSLPPKSWSIPKNVESAIICASVSGLNACESDPEGTRAINVSATLILADRLAEQGSLITFLSSSQVFGPEVSVPSESDSPGPVTEYGRQKLVIERHLMEKIPGSQIIRLTKVVSAKLPLFSTWMDFLARGLPVTAFSDLHLSPLSVPAAASGVLAVTRSGCGGVFHLSASDSTSYLEAANLLASRNHFDPSLVISSPSPRPNTPDSCRLCCERSRKLTGFQPRSALENLTEAFVQ